MESMDNQKEAAKGIELLDFLYQDKPRIASFYTQLFAGNPIAVTKHQRQLKAKEVGFGGTAGIFHASRQTSESSAAQIMEQIDPHDYSSLLLLSELGIKPVDSILPDMLGKVVVLKGILEIRNFTALKQIFPSALKAGLFDDQVDFSSDNPKRSSKKQKRQQRNLMEVFFDIVPYGIEIEITTATGVSVFGPLKPEWLTQSPEDILRTYGNNLGDNWFVMGILGQPSKPMAKPTQELRKGMDEFTEAIRVMYAPQYGFIITPIMIYRETPIV